MNFRGARQSTDCDGSGALHESGVNKRGETASGFIFSKEHILNSAALRNDSIASNIKVSDARKSIAGTAMEINDEGIDGHADDR
jgi:hypothetical protein